MAGKENILLLGATGFIGTYITNAIVERRDSFGRIVIFTSPSTTESKTSYLNGLEAKGVEVIVGDVTNNDDLLKAYEGIDTVLSAVGRFAITLQLPWIGLASSPSTSIKRFFPSEFGTDIEYSPSSAHEPTHQAKLQVRKALREQSKLDYTFVVTGPYVEGYISSSKGIKEIGSFDVKEKKAYVLNDGKGEVSVISMPDVGKITALALLAPPSVVRNRALRVNSFTTTPLNIVAEYERQTGGQKWDVIYTSTESFREPEKKAWEQGGPAGTVYTLRRIWAEGGTLYEKRDNGLLGEEGEKTDDLETAVKKAIEEQLGSS